MEFFRSKEEPEQLWRQNDGSNGYEKGSWIVFFIHDEYHHMMDENFEDIPDYAIKGTVEVSVKNKVTQAFVENPDFDEVKIASCELKKT